MCGLLISIVNTLVFVKISQRFSSQAGYLALFADLYDKSPFLATGFIFLLWGIWIIVIVKYHSEDGSQ